MNMNNIEKCTYLETCVQEYTFMYTILYLKLGSIITKRMFLSTNIYQTL